MGSESVAMRGSLSVVKGWGKEGLGRAGKERNVPGKYCPCRRSERGL